MAKKKEDGTELTGNAELSFMAQISSKVHDLRDRTEMLMGTFTNQGLRHFHKEFSCKYDPDHMDDDTPEIQAIEMNLRTTYVLAELGRSWFQYLLDGNCYDPPPTVQQILERPSSEPDTAECESVLLSMTNSSCKAAGMIGCFYGAAVEFLRRTTGKETAAAEKAEEVAQDPALFAVVLDNVSSSMEKLEQIHVIVEAI